MLLVTVLVGVGGGIGGLAVSVLLHVIQHTVYGYTEGTFLHGLETSPPWVRVAALSAAGVIGAVGWWALRKWGAPVVSIEKSVKGQRMPVASTLLNVGLQIVIVGLGASIGREVAPRELGAMFAGKVAEWTGLTSRERRILVACGAGAGLAAVYNVPLGGAIFAIEILLGELSFATALPAFASSAIATIVARIFVPTTPLYHLPQFALTPSLFVWSTVVGPVLGLAAVGFVWLVRKAGKNRPKDWWILIVMPVVFTLVGVLGAFFPALLGNGRSLGQIAFDAALPLTLISALLVLKVVATVSTIGAGAAGGTLTPSVAIGASLGAVTGGLWALLWPGAPVAAFAFIGAAGFLASSMRAPLTALVLIVEFTGQGPALLVPAMLAIAGSVAVGYLIGKRRITGVA